MEDYKQMYLTMFNAAQDAIELLINAQQKCEEIYIAQNDNDESQKTKKQTEE